ncbi:MAG: hypothetical protein LC775_19585 [Acidobacteria bacterium]|nr:hypothetical protein [Acidobacteriota bacterium]
MARYYSSTQGRFTSVDPSRRSIIGRNPQTWNRYSYTYNNPLAMVDDNGKWPKGSFTRSHVLDLMLLTGSSAFRCSIPAGSS